MLILSRKPGQSLVIDGKIRVKVLEVEGGRVRLGIDAPPEVEVHREEVFEMISDANVKAAAGAPADLGGLGDLIAGRKKKEDDS